MSDRHGRSTTDASETRVEQPWRSTPTRSAVRVPGEHDPSRHSVGAARPGCGPTCCGRWPGGVVGYLIGHWLGNVIASGYTNVQDTGQNDVAIVLGPVLRRRRLDGRHRRRSTTRWPRSSAASPRPPPPEQSWVRYFRMTDDHKVVGLQYAVGVLAVPLHRRAAGDAHPHRAAQPDQPRLRARAPTSPSSASTARS